MVSSLGLLLGLTLTHAVVAADASLSGRTLTEIRIYGATYTRPEIITRELVSRVGEPYVEANARRDANRLHRLDIFSAVDVQAHAEGDHVVLDIHVVEIYPYLPFVSYEVTDENGFSIGPGFQSANLAGRDILISAFGRFGGATNLAFLVEDPWFAGNHLSYRLEVYRRDRANELDAFNEKATEVYLQLGSFIGDTGRVGARFSYIGIESDSTGRTLADDNKDHTPSLGVFIGYDSRDRWDNPHRGWWTELEVAKHGGIGGTDGDFWRLNADARWFIPLWKRHTLALSSLVTFTSGSVGDEIPPTADFHIGGTNSLRGWELDTQNGQHQFLNVAEYRYTVLAPRLLSVFGLNFDLGVQLAAFADLSLAWNTPEQFAAQRFHDGYGVGLRFLVPFVNQFRFDVGRGQPASGSRWHIGAWERPVAQRQRVR